MLRKTVGLIPVTGKNNASSDQIAYISNQIKRLIKERNKYVNMKEHAKSKKEYNLAKKCLRTINDSIASMRNKVRR